MSGSNIFPVPVKPGGSLSGRLFRLILDAFAARFPLVKCDIASVFSGAIDWTDGAQVPSANINVDDLFNNATGIAQALGCLDVLTGMELVYVDEDTIGVCPGHVLHRGQFKTIECPSGAEFVSLNTISIIAPDACQPTEGNPSGLDSDDWYFVYADASVASSSGGIYLSEEEPVKCVGKGFEHPTLTNYRLIGTIRTLADGSVRPFARQGDWTYWQTAASNNDYHSTGRGGVGTVLGFSSGGFVRYEASVTGSAYHDGDKHIPITASAIRIVTSDGSTSGFQTKIKSVAEDPAIGAGTQVVQNSGDMINEIEIPVNPCGANAIDQQTFLISTGPNHRLDVSAYYENLR